VALLGDGPLTVTIRASALAYARHGDMPTHFVSPVTVTMQDGCSRARCTSTGIRSLAGR
jgi:hypothetical protein